jgi:hypothetical protein
MTRIVNQPINSMVQVLNSNGDKVTDAIVNYKVYNLNNETEVWEVFASGLMTHMGDGIYNAYFTPTVPGEYTFYAYSTNPKFHEAYTYYVEEAVHVNTQLQTNVISVNSSVEMTLAVCPGVSIDHRIGVAFCYVEADLSNFSGKVTIRLYKANGAVPASSRLVSTRVYPDDFEVNAKTVRIDVGPIQWEPGIFPAEITLQPQNTGQGWVQVPIVQVAEVRM